MKRVSSRVRESLFFIPSLVLILFVGLAALAIWIDTEFGSLFLDVPVVLSVTVSGGRAIATTVAGATITVAAIVFSITALSAQMAASQYSPRTVGDFFDDPFQQTIIGLVVGTFTYSLLILAGLGDVLDDPNGGSPSLAATLDIVLGVLSAIGIVAFISHSLRRMQVDSVVRRIADDTLDSMRRDLRDTGGNSSVDASPPTGDSHDVIARRTGWVTRIDTHGLLAGLPPGTAASVLVRVGEAVSEGDRIAAVWSREDAGGASPEAPVRDAIKLASQRSITTDPGFGIRQLVDIALRALSPGVNDPTTAVDVLHHLKIPVREVLLSDAPRRVFTGEEDRRVYLAETPSRTDYVHMAFAEIRLAATDQLSVIEALVEVLEDLESELRSADLAGRAAAVEEERKLTVRMARRSGLPHSDLKRVIGEEIAASEESESMGDEAAQT